MLKTFANVFRVPDLRKKVLWTLLTIAVFRVGTYVPLPGVNTAGISQVVEKFHEGRGGVTGRALNLIDLFTGGALGRCTVFALGIMPYISASIIFQLLATVIKPLEELQREGEAGRKRINQYTRYATVVLCMVQSFFMSSWIESRPFDVELISDTMRAGPWFELATMASLTAGSVFLMWLGETVTEYGIGNGISVLIMAGIIDRMPTAARELWNGVDWGHPFTPDPGKYNLLMFVFFVVMYFGIILAVVVITQGQRRVTVQQAKRTRGHRVYGGQRHYMPLRVNQAGVIPIIFAQSLLQIPAMIFSSLGRRWAAFAFLANVFNVGSFTYTMVYVAMIFFFCYFWTAVVFNPIKMADEMKQYGHFVPGIRPGKMTAQYLERLMTRITLAGAAFLAFIAILPQLMHRTTEIGLSTAYLYGGTGLLIVVGVALEVVQKIESHLMMRHYEGFMKRGRIKSRSSW